MSVLIYTVLGVLVIFIGYMHFSGKVYSKKKNKFYYESDKTYCIQLEGQNVRFDRTSKAWYAKTRCEALSKKKIDFYLWYWDDNKNQWERFNKNEIPRSWENMKQ